MGTTAGRGDQLDLEVEPLAPLHDAPHLEALQTRRGGKVILHPPFLLAPRSMTTQSLVRAADASCQPPNPGRSASPKKGLLPKRWARCSICESAVAVQPEAVSYVVALATAAACAVVAPLSR
jgi:hypothetical protein